MCVCVCACAKGEKTEGGWREDGGRKCKVKIFYLKSGADLRPLRATRSLAFSLLLPSLFFLTAYLSMCRSSGMVKCRRRLLECKLCYVTFRRPAQQIAHEQTQKHRAAVSAQRPRRALGRARASGDGSQGDGDPGAVPFGGHDYDYDERADNVHANNGNTAADAGSDGAVDDQDDDGDGALDPANIIDEIPFDGVVRDDDMDSIASYDSDKSDDGYDGDNNAEDQWIDAEDAMDEDGVPSSFLPKGKRMYAHDEINYLNKNFFIQTSRTCPTGTRLRRSNSFCSS